MSATGELAAHLVEFGGDLHTRPGWLARDSRGEIVDGYRYARYVPCEARGCAGATCDACAWQYIGRAFTEADAVAVLLEVLELDRLAGAAADVMPARRPGDIPVGRAVWDGPTGEWSVTYGTGSGTVGGPGPMTGLADSLRRHGFTSDGWHASAGGRVSGDVYARDWSAAP